MIGSPRMDDEIIHSWCFHDVECFDSTPSAAIIILDKDLESFSSLRSQHTLTHSLSHLSLPPTHTHTHTLYHLILPPTHTLSLSHLSLPPTHTHSLTHTLVSTPFLSISLSLSIPSLPLPFL